MDIQHGRMVISLGYIENKIVINRFRYSYTESNSIELEQVNCYNRIMFSGLLIIDNFIFKKEGLAKFV